MEIIYLDGKAEPSDFYRIPQEFRKVFGGEVSSKSFTIKNPEKIEQQGYFCMQLHVAEIDGTDSFTKLKIERALKNLNDQGNFFKEMKWIKTTPDLDYIFSLNEKRTLEQNNNSIKGQLEGIKREGIDSSPATTHESGANSPDLSDDTDLPQFKA